MKEKIKIVFIPTVLTLLGLILGYTFLHWILFIKLEVYPLKEIILNFGIPFALAGLVAWFLLSPRFKILNLEAKRGNWRDFYSFILMVILAIPLLIAQEYIVTASGELTELNSISEIDNNHPTKYYSLKQYYIDKRSSGTHSAFDVSGKHNEYFNMHIYVAMPILKSIDDTTKSECFAWLGIEYKETISNRLEPNEKERLYQTFASISQRDFDIKKVSKFEYLNRIGNSDAKDGFIEAIKSNKIRPPNHTILLPVNESFDARNGSKLSWLTGSVLVGSAIWFLMLLIPNVDEEQIERIKAGRPDKEVEEDLKDALDLLKPREGYFITPILIWINIILFTVMVVAGLGFISFKAKDLVDWGANYGPITKDGEWWRLLTSIFLHGGIMHVLANMYGLLFVGIFLEPLLGKIKFLSIYILTGILGSVASIWWYDATVSVGASGAIFGLYGLFLSAMLTKLFPAEFGKAFLLSTVVFVGFNLLMGLVGGIDNAAHVGGLLSGFLIGLILYPIMKRQATEEISRKPKP